MAAIPQAMKSRSRASIRRSSAAVVAATLLAACGAESRAGGAPDGAKAGVVVAPTRRVVDGVSVMAHGADAFDLTSMFAIEPEPIAVLGGADGDPAFDLTHASEVALLADGRIVTLSGIGSKLLLFAADGRGLRSLGRMGAGPGEIMAPSGLLALGGDTLFVPDPGNNRFNWIVPDDGFVATRPMDGMRLPFMQTAGALPDGRIAVRGGFMQRGVPDEVVRPPTPLYLLDPATSSAAEIARIPDLELVMVETRYRGRRSMDTEMLGFGRRAVIAVWDTLVATSGDAGYAIDLRDDGGRIVSRLVVDRPRLPVTSAMREAWIARRLESFNTTSGERFVDLEESKRLVREAPFADSLPAYEAFFVTPNRTLWVLDPVVPGIAGWSATAFRPDGAIVGRLAVPLESRPMAFGDDRVVLRTLDENDVVSLQVHRITGMESRRP